MRARGGRERGPASPWPASSIPLAGGGKRGKRGGGLRRGSPLPPLGPLARFPGGCGGLARRSRPKSPLRPAAWRRASPPCHVLGWGCLASLGAGCGLVGCRLVSPCRHAHPGAAGAAGGGAVGVPLSFGGAVGGAQGAGAGSRSASVRPSASPGWAPKRASPASPSPRRAWSDSWGGLSPGPAGGGAGPTPPWPASGCPRARGGRGRRGWGGSAEAPRCPPSAPRSLPLVAAGGWLDNTAPGPPSGRMLRGVSRWRGGGGGGRGVCPDSGGRRPAGPPGRWPDLQSRPPAGRWAPGCRSGLHPRSPRSSCRRRLLACYRRGRERGGGAAGFGGGGLVQRLVVSGLRVSGAPVLRASACPWPPPSSPPGAAIVLPLCGWQGGGGGSQGGGARAC